MTLCYCDIFILVDIIYYTVMGQYSRTVYTELYISTVCTVQYVCLYNISRVVHMLVYLENVKILFYYVTHSFVKLIFSLLLLLTTNSYIMKSV